MKKLLLTLLAYSEGHYFLSRLEKGPKSQNENTAPLFWRSKISGVYILLESACNGHHVSHENNDDG